MAASCFPGITFLGTTSPTCRLPGRRGAVEVKGRPGLALAAALLTLAPLTAACGAGLNAETLHEGTSIDGANAQTGDLRIRDGYLAAPQGIEFPAGSDIALHVTVANIGNQPDTLTGVSTPLGPVDVQPSLTTRAVSAPSPTAGASDVSIPPGQSVTFGGSGQQLVLRQVTKPVRVAGFVPVTFTFAQAGQVTIMAPVGSGYGASAGPSSSGGPSPSVVPGSSGQPRPSGS
jgi:periplasmic copper chaperone A